VKRSGFVMLVGWLFLGLASTIASAAVPLEAIENESGGKSDSLDAPENEASDWPEYDEEFVPYPVRVMLAPGTRVISLPSEKRVDVGEIWSEGAVVQREAFWARVLSDRCALRAALQASRGQSVKQDPICTDKPRFHRPQMQERQRSTSLKPDAAR
jgi:hypothetical protein